MSHQQAADQISAVEGADTPPLLQATPNVGQGVGQGLGRRVDGSPRGERGVYHAQHLRGVGCGSQAHERGLGHG